MTVEQDIVGLSENSGPNRRLIPESAAERRTYDRGVLPFEHLRALVENGAIQSDTDIPDDQIQPASIDLRLGGTAFRVRAGFLPGRRSTVKDSLRNLYIDEVDLSGGAVLSPGSVYIVPLLERLELRSRHLTAKANPKSTTGRLDVFTRLITDYTDRFDMVRRGYRGPLFAEISPKTFSVRVQTGTRLNQLRFRRSAATDFHVSTQANRTETVLWNSEGEPIIASAEDGIPFSVDLIGRFGSEIVGWKAKSNTPVIDLAKLNYYDPMDFWSPIESRPELILETGDFYILGTRERVSVPPGYAAEMLPYDQAMGEFRVHYAGFFDPGFGYGNGELQGTRAILEVRSHEIPYALKDGQRIGRLMYERMLAVPQRLYGVGAGSSYQDQGLGLSKQFRR